MMRKKYYPLIVLFSILVLLMSACRQVPEATEAPAAEPTEAAPAAEPTEVPEAARAST